MGGPGALDSSGPAWRAAFDQAWESWKAGSLGIGAVIVDESGQIIARGRNRVLEDPGTGPISGTLLAHAEMNAFAELGLRTGAGLSLFTTMEPCLMCAATAISVRLEEVHFASCDPVYAGLEDALAAHPFTEGRQPRRHRLDDPLLAAIASILPMANRVWSRPGQLPRKEWLDQHRPCWDAAVELVDTGSLACLANDGAGLDDVLAEVEPVLYRHGALTTK